MVVQWTVAAESDLKEQTSNGREEGRNIFYTFSIRHNRKRWTELDEERGGGEQQNRIATGPFQTMNRQQQAFPGCL